MWLYAAPLMRLSELLRAQDLIVDFRPTDKWEAIGALVDHMVAVGHMSAELGEHVLEAVISRERSMSTGMENGIAIPHAAVDDLESVVACMGVVSADEGLSFESIDGRPARLIILLVIPKPQKLLHIRTLADVARLLGKQDARDALLAATSAEEAHAVLMSKEIEA